jgi:hypothetical protein
MAQNQGVSIAFAISATLRASLSLAQRFIAGPLPVATRGRQTKGR